MYNSFLSTLSYSGLTCLTVPTPVFTTHFIFDKSGTFFLYSSHYEYFFDTSLINFKDRCGSNSDTKVAHSSTTKNCTLLIDSLNSIITPYISLGIYS